MGHESTREDAEKSLVMLSQTRLAYPAWDDAIRGLVNKKLSSGSAAVQIASESQPTLTASQNLQQLAELATATGDGRDSATSKEGGKNSTSPSTSPLKPYEQLRRAIRSGYLSHILSLESGN